MWKTPFVPSTSIQIDMKLKQFCNLNSKSLKNSVLSITLWNLNSLPLLPEIEQKICFNTSHYSINRIIYHEHCIEEVKVRSYFEKIECYANWQQTPKIWSTLCQCQHNRHALTLETDLSMKCNVCHNSSVRGNCGGMLKYWCWSNVAASYIWSNTETQPTANIIKYLTLHLFNNIGIGEPFSYECSLNILGKYVILNNVICQNV